MSSYKKNTASSADRKSPEDAFAEKLTESVIQSLKDMKDSNWEKGWDTASFTGRPESLKGYQYTGRNALLFALDAARHGYSMPVYMTYKQGDEMGVHPQKGVHGIPYLKFAPCYRYNDKPWKTVTVEKYNTLSPEEQSKLFESSWAKKFVAFNVDQTDFKEKQPEKYAELMQKFHTQLPQQKDTNGMYVNRALDRMLEKQEWICPIEYQKPSSEAFYQHGDNGIDHHINPRIVIPLKSQFNKGGTPEEIYESGKMYYKTLIHEMAHSTAAKLDRQTGKKFGDAKYAKEELVAELTAAMVCNAMGFGTQIYKDDVKYVDSWLETLKKEPEFIKNVIQDVSDASKDILNKIDEQRKILGEEPLNRSFQEVENEKAASESKAPEAVEQKPQKPAAAIQTEAPVASQTNVEAPAATSRSAETQKTGSVRDTEAITVSVLHDTDGNGVVNLSDAANQDALIDAMARSANPGLKDADIKKIANTLKIIAAQTHTGPMKADPNAKPLEGGHKLPKEQDKGPRTRNL